MKGLLLAALLATCLTGCAGAATLVLRCTSPSLDDTSADCAAPVLVPTVGGLVRVHFFWTGPTVGQDSVVVAPGVPIVFTKSVPAGLYSCTATASDSLGNTSCLSNAVQKLARSKFAKVGDLR